MNTAINSMTDALQLVTIQIGLAFILGCLTMGCLAWIIHSSLAATKRNREHQRQRRIRRARLGLLPHR